MKSLQELVEFEKFDNLEWTANQIVEGFITGMHKSPYHGFSVEFAEHRLYNQGESTRHIDWKLFARTDKLFVKRFEEETNMRCNIIIDTSSSMLFPANDKQINKLTFSVYTAAALIHLLRKQRDAVGLTLFSDKVELQTETRLSESHAKMLYAELENLIKRGKHNHLLTTNVAATLHYVAEKMHKRSLVILFSDLFACNQHELFSAIEHLKHNKHNFVIFHVTDHRHEFHLSYPNRPTCFVDMETGERVKINPNDIRDAYNRELGEFVNKLKTKCGQYNTELVNADIATPFAEVLTPFLIMRGRIG